MISVVASSILLVSALWADLGATPQQPAPAGYVIGPGDQLTIKVLNAEEIGDKPVPVDPSGYISLPVVGRVKVSGRTVRETQTELAERLQSYLLKPDVSVAVSDYRSQPVSVIGAVKNPGIQQVQGRKTLIEVLSLAGGLDSTAGSSLKITRRLEFGRIPLPDAADDATGQYSLAEVSLKALVEARSPEQNIYVQPFDVVSVPRHRNVYVIGQVVRSGEFPLHEREKVTALQALSMAGGLDRFAKPEHTRILRKSEDAASRTELPVDLAKILAGKAPDIDLLPEDIVFVPNNLPKKAAVRALEAAVEMGTGIVIWRR